MQYCEDSCQDAVEGAASAEQGACALFQQSFVDLIPLEAQNLCSSLPVP